MQYEYIEDIPLRSRGSCMYWEEEQEMYKRVKELQSSGEADRLKKEAEKFISEYWKECGKGTPHQCVYGVCCHCGAFT